MRVKTFPKSIEVDCRGCNCGLEVVPSDILHLPKKFESELYVVCCNCHGVIVMDDLIPSDWKAELCS